MHKYNLVSTFLCLYSKIPCHNQTDAGMKVTAALYIIYNVKALRHLGTKALRFPGIFRLSALVPKCLSASSLCLCAFVPLCLISCDAPRHNPLDPENPDNQYHYIQGTVQSLSIPHQPLAGVSVSWPEQSLLTLSDTEGGFHLEMINPRDGWVYLQHDKFCTDSAYISWQSRQTVILERYLNSMPQIDSMQIYSIILNRYPNLQTEQIVVRTKITDADNDIDSVLAINHLTYTRHVLTYNINDKWYEKALSLYELQISKTEEIIGHLFEISVNDIFNRTLNIGAGDVQRVMREEVIFISPSGNETTPPQPVLNWQKYQAGFNFTLQVQVFKADIIPELVWEKNQLSAETVTCNVDQVLPAGEYFWVIWAIDEFGNRTRSKPASFKVE